MHRSKSQHTSVVLFTLVFTTSLYSQTVNQNENKEQAPIANEITVKAKKETFQDSLEVREIRESNARDAGEALEKLEGISKIRKGGIANDIIIRGMSKDNINVLIDGQRLYGACPSRMDPAAFHVDFAEIDLINVIKGPYNVKKPGWVRRRS